MRRSFAGKTALVTGASAGIGREIARQLASDVDALVLVARRADRLQELAEELRAGRPTLRVDVRAVDLGGAAARRAFLDELERGGVAVDVLINNAGHGAYGLFEQVPWERLRSMLDLNVVAATELLHRLVPPMIVRGWGAILNVGSSAGMVPMPGGGTYAATKAYLNHLSEALRAELSGTGVSVTALCPGPVPTEFQDVGGYRARKPLPEVLRVDAQRCAREAVEGLRLGKARVIPGAAMRLSVATLEALPPAALRPLLGRSGRRIRRESER